MTMMNMRMKTMKWLMMHKTEWKVDVFYFEDRYIKDGWTLNVDIFTVRMPGNHTRIQVEKFQIEMASNNNNNNNNNKKKKTRKCPVCKVRVSSLYWCVRVEDNDTPVCLDCQGEYYSDQRPGYCHGCSVGDDALTYNQKCHESGAWYCYKCLITRKPPKHKDIPASCHHGDADLYVIKYESDESDDDDDTCSVFKSMNGFTFR